MKIEAITKKLDAAALAPFQHLLDRMKGTDVPEPTGYHVLVMQYVRPDTIKTGSGFTLHVAGKTQREDEYQGRVGLVLAVGPDAYKDTVKFPGGAWCAPGDTVLWPPVESAATRFKYGGKAGEQTVLALLPDDRILARGVQPEKAVA